MAYYPWRNALSTVVSIPTKIARGTPDAVKLNGSIWPTSINDGESPPPINESRWGEKTICVSMHAFVNNTSTNILHVTPFKMLRSNIDRQSYDILSSTPIDGLPSKRAGWNSEDPEVGDKFQADTTGAAMIGDRIFVSTNDSLIYKLYNEGSDLEPEFIVLEIIDPAQLYPALNRTSMIRGLDNAQSKIWICESINNYLFIVFVNKLIILGYDIEAANNYTVRYSGYLPDMNTKYTFSSCDNSSPLSPGRHIDPARDIPEYDIFIGWKDQAFVDGFKYKSDLEDNPEGYQNNPIAYNDNLISPKWMGDPSSGYFMMYNTASGVDEYGSTPWPLEWSMCGEDQGGEYGGEYGYNYRTRMGDVGTRLTTNPPNSSYLKTNYRLIAIGWNSAGEPWPFMTTSARSGAVAFAGTVIPSVELPDWRISNDDGQIIKVKITGDGLVIEGQTANYTVSITDENDQPYVPINDVIVYVGYFLGKNTEETDLNNPPSQMIIAGGSSTGSFVINTNDQDEQLDLNRSIDVSVLDIQRDEFQLVEIDSNSVHTIIEDSEVKPIVEFLIESQSTIEQVTTLQVTISANISATEQDILIPFFTTGDAKIDIDYTKSHIDSILMPIATNSVTVTVDIIADSFEEPHKDIVFTLGDPQYATLGTKIQHVITILGQDTVSLEEAAGPTTLIFSNGYSSNKFWGQTGVGNSSPSAITSPLLSTEEVASLHTTATGPGLLTFDWNNTSGGRVELYADLYSTPNEDGVLVETLYNGYSEWQESGVPMFTEGEVDIAWILDASGEYITDGFHIDNIFWKPMTESALSAAISDTGYEFTTDGTYPFIGQDIVISPVDGSTTAAAIIPPPPQSDFYEIISVETDVDLTNPTTDLSFDFMLINAHYYDKLELYIDGYVRATYSENYGYNPNQLYLATYPVGSGQHNIRWRYTKYPSSNASATVMIDNVKFIES